MRADDQTYLQYVQPRLPWLRRTAYLLCQDWHQADDLVQTTVTRLYVHWRRVSAADNLDAYTRKILIRVFLGERRGGWARRVWLVDRVPDLPAGGEPSVHPELRAALAGLGARQRATLVLRFFCDLSVEETAEVLRCSAGTVKSQTARGLERLRTVLGEAASGRRAL